MNIKDRTREFNATLESALSRSAGNAGGYNDPLLGSAIISRSPKNPHSEFTQRATEINNGIQRVLSKLEKLTKLVKNKTIFDDRPTEVQELTRIIKQELGILDTQINDLRNAQKMRKSGGYIVGSTRSSEEHSSQVVISLQSRLREASSAFTGVLEMQSQSMKAQKSRREQFSATTSIPVPSVSRQRTNRDSPIQEPHDPHVSIEMPTTNSLQELSLISTKGDTSYLESRNAAIQGIESTINELGTIYRQLASMIAEQGEMVHRIDMNVDEMHLNVERGQGELLKYLRNVSSNRWLMIKIFAILIIFVIFFSVFLI